MKDWSDLRGSGQNEALVNELKGNLFEYLVGSLYAQNLGLESKFINDFDQQNEGQSKSSLVSYQQWLIKADRDLYLKLPQLAKAAFEFTKTHTDLLRERKWQQIIVVGKMASGMGDDSLAESDLLFIDDKKRKIGLSLKLVKKNAFVNTKSAGIRSFIQKYFSGFSKAQAAQEELCQHLDKSFTQMLSELYEYVDLDAPVPIAAQRSIDPLWVERGYPELPGELEPNARKILHAHYHRLSQRMECIFKDFFDEDRELFLDSLVPLTGFGFEDIRQLTCYHENRYAKASFNYENYVELKESLKHLNFSSNVESEENFQNGKTKTKAKSGFEMNFPGHILQIRLKPMNKFTVSGLKVNCSVKVV